MASRAKCSGAWTGTITYTKTQSMTDSKTVDRVSARGQDRRQFEMKLDYKASVVVIESPEKNNSSIGKATIDHKYSTSETSKATEKNSCDKGKTWREMSGVFTSKSEITGNGTGEANVSVGVNSDGTYTVGVGLPEIKGKITGSETSVFSGQCTSKEGKNLSLPTTPTNIQGNSLSSIGTDRVNPSDPNRISGSYSQTVVGITETITWNLQRCGSPLRITDMMFEDMKFPTWNDWHEISELKGTTDGNLVRIKAKVLNLSGETKYGDVRFLETYKGDKWDGARKDEPLRDIVVSVKVDPGEEKEVEFVWNSSGYAWFDDGRPRLVQRIKAELEESGKKIDEITKNIKVAPKPVVLIHGAWSHWKQFEAWQNIFTTVHSYDWKAFPVGERTDVGIINTGRDPLSDEQTNSTPQNAETLKKYIKYAQEDRNAWQVDVVAHSIGGLIARYYINQLMPTTLENGRPQIAHLLMLGTPNTGTPCADVMNFAFSMTGTSPRVVQEMTQDAVAAFNQTNLSRKGVKFSALAGNPLPVTCKTLVPNDGFVPVPSAQWKITDTALTDSLHYEMTGSSELSNYIRTYGHNTKGAAVFSSFVKPHLAIGPKGNHDPVPPSRDEFPSGPIASNQYGAFFMNARYSSEPQAIATGPNSTSDFRPDFAKRLTLAAKQSIEIEIPIEQANNFGLTFMAPSDISFTLINENGEIVGKNLAKTAEANGLFRSIFYDKLTVKSAWKLRLENTSDMDLGALIAAWKDAAR
ncbi:MAG: hypothetical protein WBB81_04245 [Pyrinomonadaceae bacterium]